jgi:integrase/recombinase XerD
MRVSELVGLKRAAVMRDASFLTIVGKGNKERIVPVNDRARDAVKAWVETLEGGPWLFPAKGEDGHLSRQVFARDLKALAGRTGISSSRVAPHVLRHAFASHLLQGGADLRVVQTLLGHADISTTQIYTHVLDEKLRTLVEQHHPLADKS